MQGTCLFHLITDNLLIAFFFNYRMGSLSQMLQNIGVKGDTVGQASAPNMIIPPPTISLTDVDDTTSSNRRSEDDEDSMTVSDKRSSINSIMSTSSNEDDKYFEDSIEEKKKPSRKNSIHPGNSVWVDHSY
jgi:hypothetical protein